MTDTSSTGSSSDTLALSAASRSAARPAFWKAMSEESTEWALPSYRVTRMSTMGYPASTHLLHLGRARPFPPTG